MAQSPTEAGQEGDFQSYKFGWKAIFRLMKEGKSWSGREANCVFLNTGGSFADVSGVSGLDFLDDARALAVVDWDHDGALDLWLGNRSAPQTRFMRNTSGGGSDFVSVRLRGTNGNTDAIGARVDLFLDDGRRLVRTLHAGDGYLSQSTKWVHFGLGETGAIERLTVRWPGGATEEFPGLSRGNHYRLVQGSGAAERWTPPTAGWSLPPSPVDVPEPSGRARIVLADRVPLPRLTYLSADGGREALVTGEGPLLVNLWGSWCAPCIAELGEFTKHQADLSGLRIVALSVDEVENRPAAAQLLEGMGWPFEAGYASPGLLDSLDIIQRAMLLRKRRLPLPTSFLVTTEGDIAVIYKGPVGVETLRDDLPLLDVDKADLRRVATPFPGRWVLTSEYEGNLTPGITRELFEKGLSEAAGEYFLLIPPPVEEGGIQKVTVQDYLQSALQLALDAFQAQRYDLAARLYARSLDLVPDSIQARTNLAIALERLDRVADAEREYRKILELRPKHGGARAGLAGVLIRSEEYDEAVALLEGLLVEKPKHAGAHWLLGYAYDQLGRREEGYEHIQRSVELNPNNSDAQAYLSSRSEGN